MGEYIIYWDGIGATLSDMLRDRVPLALWAKRIRRERLREPVVRCRDCKHMHTVRSWTGADVDECWLHADQESGALGKEPTEPDGFCAWGERKEAGE